MTEFYYTSSNGAVARFDSETALGFPSKDMRGHSYNYELEYKSVSSIQTRAREVGMAYVGTYESMDELLHMAGTDVEAKSPGTITYEGWSQSAYIVKSEPSQYKGGLVATELTVLLLDGEWHRETQRVFFASEGTGGFDYEHDYDFDFGYQSGLAILNVGGGISATARIEFMGPAVDPHLTIAGNRYQVNANVSSGHKVVLDFTTEKPTVLLVDPYGNEQSIFSSAVRDGGVGGGSYAFQRIPTGEHELMWDGSFSFSIAVKEIEKEPPWSL